MNIKIEITKEKEYSWTEEQLKHIEEIKKKYPEGKEQSALLDVLHYAQDSFEGWLPVNLMKLVAKTLNIPLIRIEEVVSFYTMLHSEPIGKYYIQVCTHCSCMMNGSSSILKVLQDETVGQDELFTIQDAECLGSCATGPVVVVNGEYHENMTPEKTSALIKELKKQSTLCHCEEQSDAAISKNNADEITTAHKTGSPRNDNIGDVK